MATRNIARQSRRVKFTSAFISSVINGKKPGKWSDSASPLSVKSTAKGAQFYVQKKVDGRPVTVTPRSEDGKTLHNTATFWTLEQARDWAREVVVALARGEDPVPGKAGGDTFAELAEIYLERTLPGRTTSSARTVSNAVSKAVGVLGPRKFADIGAPEATLLKETLSASPATAKHAWSASRAIGDLALERGLVPLNLFRALPAPKPPAARSRFPRLHELTIVEQACLGIDGPLRTGADIVRFLFRLPLRKSAAASLKWAEVDLVRGELNLQGGDGRKMPEGVSYRLPLVGLALEFLKDRKPVDAEPGDLVFAHTDGGMFPSWTALYKRLRAHTAAKGMGPWTPHDARRMAVSETAEHYPDVSADDLDRLLTHSQSSTNSGTKAVYQRATGWKGMVRAAEAWDTLLRSALGENVVTMPVRSKRA